MSSIPLLDAASISIKSIAAPSFIDVHDSQALQGSVLLINSEQLSALSRILAIDVFPIPRVPVNKYAW